MKISLIITTYNWLPALQMILQALSAQKDPGPFEVIIADDGSTPATGDWLKQQITAFPLLHVWQPDIGFRAAKIRNKAVAKASGDYVIFLDGDCIPRVDFIRRHRELAQTGYFVSGNRVLLSATFTMQALEQQLPLHTWRFKDWLLARWRKQCNRCLPLLSLPKPVVYRQYTSSWQGAKTCNLALWRQDFLRVNGFEEQYQGWGYEDSDLVIRLQRAGVRRKSGRFAVPVLHLWHAENDRSQRLDNFKALQSLLNSDKILAQCGIDQYIPVPPPFEKGGLGGI